MTARGCRRAVTLAAITLAIAVLGACSGDDAPSGEAARPTSTTVPGAGPTTTAASQPPGLANTGDDPVAATLSIASYRRWLIEHPQPNLLETIVRRSCRCWDANFSGLDGLANKGWRYDPALPPYEPPEVSLRDRPAPDTAVVYVLLPATPATRVVDSTGAVVQDLPATGRRAALYSLVREGGRWRIGDISEVGPVGGGA